MATQKPISTISYNTEVFLREKLENWLKAHIIQSYQYICHKGEDGDKDHIHLRIEPNKKLDVMDLSESLKEYEIGKEKPRGCRPWRPSKEEDWWLYAVHDKAYLQLKYGGGDKGEKLPYKWQDVKCPEDYDGEVAYIRAKASLEHSAPNIAQRLKEGEQAFNLISEGSNPFTVSTILRTLKYTDYERVQIELQELRSRYFSLMRAVDANHFDIVVHEDGTTELKLRDINEEDF